MSKDVKSNGTFFDDLDMSMFSNDFMSSDKLGIVKDDNDDDKNERVDDSSISEDEDTTIVDQITEDGDDDDTTEVEEDTVEDVDDESIEEEEVEESTTTDDVDDLDNDYTEAEQSFVNYLSERLKDKGIEFDEEELPTNVDDLVNFFEDIAEDLSMPDYSSEDLKNAHEFEKNGGDPKEYFLAKYGETDLETIDIDKESNQKLVVSQYLKNKGYSDKRIDRTLERFEEAGILAEEAEDALEELKEINENNAKELLKQQELQKKQILEQQQKFLTTVKSNVDNIDNIRGIKVSRKEKDRLMEYIFKPDSNGQTQYQKDYNKDYYENLIESAYFTMNKDSFVKKVEKSVSTNVKKDMYKKIKNTSNRKTKGASKRFDQRSNGLSAFDSVFSTLG